MEVIRELIKIIPGDHIYYLPNNSTPCYACQFKSNLKKKSTCLKKKGKQLKQRSIMKPSAFTWRKTKTDAKMKFCTWINTIILFNKIFRLIQPFFIRFNLLKGAQACKKP